MNIRNYLNSIPEEEIERRNQEMFRKNKEMFKDFQEAFKQNCCALCGNKLDYFIENEPCFHWFTLPKGIKKKHFKDYLKEPVGYSKLESYFRWMATIIEPLKNINDLSDEMTVSKLREVTVKFNNIEWSLTYGQSDLDGHKDSKNANFPHFHLQVLQNDRPFIRFNDFHIPFSKFDLFNFKLAKEAGDLVQFSHSQGEGMSVLEDEGALENLNSMMKVADEESSASFNTSSMVIMPEGETMSDKALDKLFEESKLTKIPIRKLIEKYHPNAKIITEITPGKGVPEIKKRNKRN